MTGPSTGNEASVLPITKSAPTSGSTKLTDGRVPLAQSSKKSSSVARWPGYLFDDRGDDRRVGMSVK